MICRFLETVLPQTLRLRGLAGFAALALLFWAQCANAGVTISRQFATEPVTQSVEIGAGKFATVPLPGGDVGDRYQIEISVGNQVYRDLSAFVVDDQNLRNFQRRERFLGSGRQQAQTPFVIQYQVNSPGRYFVVLDNTYALLVKKSVSITTRMATEMPPELASSLKGGIESIYAGLSRLFIFPSFDIRVIPCGQVNAFSAKATGDISICTETISKAAGKPGAFSGVLLHELGHTLLGQWGLPGADNEDMADEFSVQFLARLDNGANRIQEFANFFAGGNPWIEARSIIQRGDRHTISTQRIRNIQNWAQDSRDLVERWNRLIYPHMTDEALKAIASRAGQYDDRGLADTELRRRGLVQSSK